MNEVLKFKGYCAERNIKQEEIAKILNITVSNANRKINGKDPFTLEQVKILCKHYGISADEYFV
jgi:plasmid maintenance system antidote protein VapI